MRQRSLKLQRAMRVYRVMVREFLEDNPTCQFPIRCDQPATVVHHRRGRFGKRLIDQAWWAASCHEHNTYAEEHTGHSLDLGWLVPINSEERSA